MPSNCSDPVTRSCHNQIASLQPRGPWYSFWMGGGLLSMYSCDAEARTSLLMAVKTRKRSKGGFSQLPVCGVTKSRDTAVGTSGLWRSQETLTPRAGAFPQSHNCFLSLRSGFHEEEGSMIVDSQINTVSLSFRKDNFVCLFQCPNCPYWSKTVSILQTDSHPSLVRVKTLSGSELIWVE